MQNILGNNFRKFFGISLTALLLFGGFFVANNVSSIALPGSTLIFEDNFDQSGNGMTNKWDDFSGSSDGSRVTTDTEGSGSSDDFTVGVSSKGLLLEGGSSGSNPDEGVEREISTMGYSSLDIEYSRAWKGGETDDTFVAYYSLDEGPFTILETQALGITTAHTLVTFNIANTDRNTKIILRFEVNGSETNDNLGIDDVKIYGSNAPLFYDGFESDDFSAWTNTEETPDAQTSNTWTDGNTSASAHSTHLTGSNGADPDDAIEKEISTTGFQNIKVRYAREVDITDGSPFDDEFFKAKFWDGSIWTDIEVIEDATMSSTMFTLPTLANNNPDFKLRFEMDASNSSSDNAYLDDVVIWGDELTTGSITINKTTVGGDGTFSFTRTGSEETTQITTQALSGSATIENLEPGDYTITETEQEGWSTENNTCVVTVSSGNTESCSFTNTKLSTIVGFKFEDSNGNGAWEEGELGVANWPMFLGKVGQRLLPEQPAGPGNEIPIEMVAMELTGSSPIGQVQFDNLELGDYKIFEGQQTGWAPTTPQIDSFFDITYQIDWQGIAQAPFIESFFDVFVELPGQVLNQGTPSCGQESCPLSPIAFGNFHNITITVEKDVVNPQGEVVEDNHNFSLRLDEINGETITQGTVYTFSENNAKVYTNIGLGTYKISETNGEITGDPDFDLLAISNDNDADPTNGYTFNVESGQDITITITNQQKQGSLTVRKVVTHPNLGVETANQFSFTVNDEENDGDPIQFIQNGENTLMGENILPINPGTYTIEEIYPENTYAISYSLECTNVVIESNDTSAICTITNSDIPTGYGAITVIKDLPNDNGGTFSEGDFPLTVTRVPETEEEAIVETQMSSGISAFFTPGNYTISESNPGELDGFTQSISCTDGETIITNGSISVALQQAWICTITNDDQPGSLTIIKNTGNANHNGTFNFTISGTDLTPSITTTGGTGQTAVNLDKGSYNVVETDSTGWNFSGASCEYEGESAGVSIENGESIYIDSGDSVTCSFINSVIMPKLTVTKVVINDNGRTKTVEEFPLFVGDNPVASGILNELNPGIYTVSETEDVNYQKTITGDCDAGGNITLNPGDVKSCTITNNDIAPIEEENTEIQGTITVTKVVINNNGGTKTVADFPLFVNTTPVTSGEAASFDAGTYTISETQQSGYTAVISGDCAEGSIVLLAGDEKNCTITNDDVAQESSSGGSGGGGGGGGQVFTITSSNSTGGLVNPLGSLSVASGNSYTVTIAPDSGFQIADVLVDGSSVGSQTTYTFSNISANHTISASFSVIPIIAGESTSTENPIPVPTPTPTPTPTPEVNTTNPQPPTNSPDISDSGATDINNDVEVTLQEPPVETIAENGTNLNQPAALGESDGANAFLQWIGANWLWLLILILLLLAAYWYYQYTKKNQTIPS
ncbi:MAG: hypothetical protein A3D34_00145 [Candidatus Staskawiczbacteria bacterium RIFCSPHIGHO2_02_FULL_33_16]|uniref:SD-repeat containing protein B domain-containing protein n=1 Tax=Candidatus Staskawiczbacteria bacterium RIFCSPHIGHO2_02_FULL_33_16 TaxID=1802204 RepID=A0A1G2HSU4_9BACT|nr:MAG: hypothetical protein A3D34_00145 [Candidatus Staskawiczbacteria bacterium RIFCSPHIGHO2_02_FULL_33_16]